MRLSLVLSFALLISGIASAQEHGHLRFFLKGKQVGENTFERSKDGSFKSNTTMDVSSPQSSTMTGRFEDGRLTEAVWETTTGDGSRKSVLADGHVLISSGGQSATVDWKDTNGAILPGLHPQLFASGLLLAEKTIAGQTGMDSTVLPVYDPSGGMSMPLRIGRPEVKSAKFKGKEAATRVFRVEAHRMVLIFVLDAEGHVVGFSEPYSHVTAVADDWEGLFPADKS